MKKALYLVPFLCLLMMVACSGDQGPKYRQHHRYDMKMSRTGEDSTAILNLTTQYLDLLKEGQYDEALGMLYTYNREDSLIHPISDERREVLRQSFASFPVLDYAIDTVLMYSDFDTEVRYTYQFFEKTEDSTLPNTMHGTVCPHRFDGVWYLTVPKEKSEGRNVIIRTRD